ncbi:helix-turn-helix domain-containing protein [Streptacidiphilus sp. N1-3]|uniref:Helix-turn-helix domain-containing protein n=1 Tax=Streptacidiphilus alkalitolerans TaxID=3342712 RepID=A0ABV6WU27_9ACTN
MNDFQQARIALGTRLREMRAEAGLSGRDLAARLGWPQSRVSKLETGRQTATAADLDAWAEGTGHPADASELKGRLLALETSIRSWKRALAGGHRAVQEANVVQEQQAEHIRLFEAAIIPGLFQISEYARAVLTDVSERHGSPRDIDAGVRARLKRQEILYQPGHRVDALIWEPALLTVRCSPDAMIDQLDRLIGFMDLGSVTLGIVPLGARTHFSPKGGFWIIDDTLVVADTWSAEMWLDAVDDLALYRKIFQQLSDAAVYGRGAQRLIARARAVIESP